MNEVEIWHYHQMYQCWQQNWKRKRGFKCFVTINLSFSNYVVKILKQELFWKSNCSSLLSTLIKSPDTSLWCTFISIVNWTKRAGPYLTFAGLEKEHKKRTSYHLTKYSETINRETNYVKDWGNMRVECRILWLLGSAPHVMAQVDLALAPGCGLWPRPCSSCPQLCSAL